nr:hypothetical protein [Mucilaginibacter sp. X4EP1]
MFYSQILYQKKYLYLKGQLLTTKMGYIVYDTAHLAIKN